MKNKLHICYLVLLLFALTNSNNFFAGSKWTIMIYMNADNNLDPNSVEDFMEMSNIGSTEEVSILLQWDRVQETTTLPEWDGTNRFFVKKDLVPIEENAIMQIGESNMGDPLVLIDFIKWSMQNYPSEKYMLLIWEHGDGWRSGNISNIKVTPKINERYLKDMRIISEFDFNVLKEFSTIYYLDSLNNMQSLSVNEILDENPFKGLSYDQSSQDYLYNRELQDILEKNILSKKIDIIAFDACLMGMIETGYAFRNVSNYFVASETYVPAYGFNYSTWLGELIKNPNADGKNLCKYLINSYEEQSLSLYKNGEGEHTLSATDLTYMDDLANTLSKLAELFVSNMDEEIDNIKTARNVCGDYGGRHKLDGIDIKLFLNTYLLLTKNSEIILIAKKIIDLINRSILYNFATKRMISFVGKQSYGSNGIAIFFPKRQYSLGDDSNARYYNDNNRVYPVEFVLKHKWDNFLQEYFKRVK